MFDELVSHCGSEDEPRKMCACQIEQIEEICS